MKNSYKKEMIERRKNKTHTNPQTIPTNQPTTNKKPPQQTKRLRQTNNDCSKKPVKTRQRSGLRGWWWDSAGKAGNPSQRDLTLTSPCSSKNSFLCRCRVSITFVRIWGSLSLIVKYAKDLRRRGSKFYYWEEIIKYLLFFLNKCKVLKVSFCAFKAVDNK